MKSLIGLVLMIIFSFNCFGQKQTLANQNDTSIVRLSCCSDSLSNSKVLLIVNNKPYSIKYINGLNPKIIDDVSVFRSGEAIKKYGSKAKEGVIVIATNKKVKWIKTSFLLKANKIDQQYLNLPIVYSGKILETPYILTKKHIKHVVILKEVKNFDIGSQKITGKYLFIDETNVAPAL